MSTLSIVIVSVFVIGYLLIALESLTKVNKAAIALFMFVAVWTLYMLDPAYFVHLEHPQFESLLALTHPDLGKGVDHVLTFVNDIIQNHLGDTGTTLFFLMGAMTIVEVVDQNGGFDWVRRVMHTRTKRALLWRIAFMSFGHIRQHDNVYRDDHDTAQVGKRPQRPHDIRRPCYCSCQLRRRLLAHRRCYHHHVMEQRAYHSPWRYQRDTCSLAHIHGAAGLCTAVYTARKP